MTKEEILKQIQLAVYRLDSWVGRACYDGMLPVIEIKDFEINYETGQRVRRVFYKGFLNIKKEVKDNDVID